jgi:hypothetical protein
MYSEFQFKSELIGWGAGFYRLNELKINPWEKTRAHTDPTEKNPITRVNVLTAWRVYKKCYEETGDMVMGRLADTQKHYQRYGLEKDRVFNLDPGQRINVQNLKNWTVCINDCWMLGAIHRCATFNLVSKIESNESIYNFGRGFFIVTGRELQGLRLFGYQPHKQGNQVSFHCKDRGKAQSATLREYATSVLKADNSINSVD